MAALDNKRLSQLKSLCHHLRPVVMIGQKGLHAGVIDEIDLALEHHELIKIRINVDRDEREKMIREICEQTGAQAIQVIGHMVSLFRENPQQPKILCR